MELQALIERAHKTAVEHGWWEGGDRSAGDQFANFHGEISEAWEEWRKYGWNQESMLYTAIANGGDEPLFEVNEGDKPEGIAAELADVLIRIFDTCGRYDIPLEKALQLKMAFNETREYRHGGKKVLRSELVDKENDDAA